MDDYDWDFTDDTRGDNFASGCLIAVGAFVFGVLAVVWIAHNKRFIEIVVLLSIAAMGLWLARGSIAALFKRRVRLDPTAVPTPLADLKPGAVHATGLLGISAPPIHAPLGAPECAFFRIVVISEAKVLFEARSADELLLDDGGGHKLLVRLDGAKWLVHRWHEMDGADHDVRVYFSQRGLDFDPNVRVRIAWIAHHELVFVRGVAKETSSAIEAAYRTSEGKSPLEIASTPERPVLLALEPIPLKSRSA